MSIQRRTRFSIAVVLVVALAGAGVGAAIGATTHHSTKKSPSGHFYGMHAHPGTHFGLRGGPGHGGQLAAAAAYLGVSTESLESSLQSGKTLAQIADATSGKSAAGLISALVTAAQAKLAAAVTAGTLTQAQSDKISTNLTARVTAFVNGTFHGRGGWGMGHRGGRGLLQQGLAAAASYLGVSTDSLESSLQSGKTLAQIADATSGKSAAGLISALVTAAQAKLAAAVTAGTLTQAQSDQISKNLTTMVTDLVNDTRPARGPGAWKGEHHGGFMPSKSGNRPFRAAHI